MHRYEYSTQNRVFIFVIGRARENRVPCVKRPQRGGMTGDNSSTQRGIIKSRS